MEHRDEAFASDQIEEQIETYLQSAAQSSLNAQMLHDLQHVSHDDAHRLAQIRERLIEHVRENRAREPVSLQRYRQPGMPSPRREPRHRAKRSPMQWASGIAVVLVIASVLLVFARFRPHQEQANRHTSRPAPSTVAPSIVSINGKSAFLIDMTTDKVLIDVHGNVRLPVGDMAQMMIAVVAIDNADLNQYITIEQSTLNEVPQGGRVAHLLAGDRIQLRQLLYALLLSGGDDAALVIARAVGGDTQNFIAMMNDEARQLQLHDTHFSTPYGSATAQDYSSAADLTYLTNYAMLLFDFAQIVATPKYTLDATNSNHSYVWSPTNPSLPTYPGVHRIYTGYDAGAGTSIVFSVQRKGHLLLGAEMGAPSENALVNDVKKLVSLGSSG